MAQENYESYDATFCCNCGCEEYSIVASGPVIPVVVCRKCGLMRQGFSSGGGSQPFTSYAGGDQRFFQQRKDKEESQVQDFLKIIPQLELFLSQKGRLLEIGCAMGTLLNEIRKLEWDVVGVEPEKWTCELARKEYNLEVINETFQDAGLHKNSFDVVLMLHVIEHLPNPKKGLSQIVELLRPGGFLVLETPRFDTTLFKILKGRERSVIRGHYYYFTRETMKMLAEQSGFELVRLDSVGRTLTLDRLCFYAAKFLDSNTMTSLITSLSDRLELNKKRVHINLRDMMRLYLRKVG